MTGSEDLFSVETGDHILEVTNRHLVPLEIVLIA